MVFLKILFSSFRSLGRMPAIILCRLIAFYQKNISRYISCLSAGGPACRFYPSCSVYFSESVKKYGFLLGSLKGLGRIFRCHPFSLGGYDPV